MLFNLHHGDCLAVLRTLPDNSVDAVVTDPPYGLSFMGKKWDYDVPSIEVWAECLRVLKPGGHLLAFAGTRTQHRMAVRIEDAGFEIRDMIAWVYGSGFPKSLDVSKAIDKAAGAERAKIRIDAANVRNPKATGSGKDGAVGASRPWIENALRAGYHEKDSDEPATPEAQQWQGWGTALKPAWESVVVARKPLISTVAENVLAHGTGAINVDRARITGEASRPLVVSDRKNGNGVYRDGLQGSKAIAGGTNIGRWPSNFIHDGSDEVTRLMTGGEARFFYTAKASKADRDEGLEGFEVIIYSSQLNGEGLWDQEEELARLLVDTDNLRLKVIAASGALSKNAIEWNTFLFGSAQTGRCQQNTTFTTETESSSTTELKILNCFQRLLTKENTVAVKFGMVSGGSHVESVERGTQQMTITSAKMESAHGADRVASKTRLRISVSAKRNNHVTVKPTDLMRYLCRLVTPPEGVVLDPFMGSGSTGKAAILEGFSFIGIEREAEYIEIARARIESAQSQPKQTDLF